MATRWAYASSDPWSPGVNVPALQKGGARGGASLNAAGIQCFGNCVTNLEKLPAKSLKGLFIARSGNRQTGPAVDAVAVVAELGGLCRKTARGWHASLKEKGWPSAFTEGQKAEVSVGTTVGLAVGTLVQEDGDTLPYVLPAVCLSDDDEESEFDWDTYLRLGGDILISGSASGWLSWQQCGWCRDGKKKLLGSSRIG